MRLDGQNKIETRFCKRKVQQNLSQTKMHVQSQAKPVEMRLDRHFSGALRDSKQSPHIRQPTRQRSRSSHSGRYKMGAAIATLATFEIAVRG
jgi:hypothetical protein